MLGAGDEGVLSQLTIEIGEVPVKGRIRKREIGNKIMAEKGIINEALWKKFWKGRKRDW